MPFVLLGLFEDDGPLATAIAYEIVKSQALQAEFWESSLSSLHNSIYQ